MPRKSDRRRVCFVTGTRAESGLMARTLRAIAAHPRLKLQIIATGMHLDRRRGHSLRDITRDGWHIDRIVPWRRSDDPTSTAIATGSAIAGLARAFDDLDTHIVMVVGDRVEAFAAASAGHISGRVVAHIHGGDRAQGQVDDSLRHAITKLAHVHFAATQASANRILQLGEDRWRVHRVGSPGIEGIVNDAAPGNGTGFALLALHPVDADEAIEFRRAKMVLEATRGAGVDRIVIVYPNNDPGSDGIARAWRECKRDPDVMMHRNIARPQFLGLMKRAAVMVGNSSSGIIEAASFGLPVVDVGPRQRGRERGGNVVNVRYSVAITRAVRSALRGDRTSKRNVYGGSGTGRKIASTLAALQLDDALRRKLIAY